MAEEKTEEQAFAEELLRISADNVSRWQSQIEQTPMQRPVYTEAMGAVRCHWCLEWFRPADQNRTPEELGALKTKLSIPDKHTPVICNVCFEKQMSEDLWTHNPFY